ncbi:MAG: hypothetical protein O2955_12100, partial [Planctomycetota bacterium]|nr:hypothetical protein [Planctomycetota bacterium]
FFNFFVDISRESLNNLSKILDLYLPHCPAVSSTVRDAVQDEKQMLSFLIKGGGRKLSSVEPSSVELSSIRTVSIALTLDLSVTATATTLRFPLGFALIWFYDPVGLSELFFRTEVKFSVCTRDQGIGKRMSDRR